MDNWVHSIENLLSDRVGLCSATSEVIPWGIGGWGIYLQTAIPHGLGIVSKLVTPPYVWLPLFAGRSKLFAKEIPWTVKRKDPHFRVHTAVRWAIRIGSRHQERLLPVGVGNHSVCREPKVQAGPY